MDGFLDMTFNKDVNSFRNETIVKVDKADINKLSFDLNSDESYELVKIDGKWTIDGAETDSAKTDKALTTLSRLTNTNFLDNISNDLLPPQTQRLLIELSDQDPIEIIGFQDNTNYIVQSSLNLENYFDGKQVGDKIFLKKESLF